MSDGSHEIERIREEKRRKKIEERVAIWIYRFIVGHDTFEAAEKRWPETEEGIRQDCRRKAIELLTIAFEGEK